MSRNHPLLRIGESLHSLKAIAPARQLMQSAVIELLSPQVPHFVFALTELSRIPLDTNNQHAPASTSSSDSWPSIKQRLQTLEELRQEGLLSEKEYQHTRQDILEEL